MVESKYCTGCAACSDVCPCHAVTMKADKEGFVYPNVDNRKCVNCGLCEKVCPVQRKTVEPINSTQCFALKHRDARTRMNSSSGGVFPELASAIISKGGVVWGATFDEKFQVIHYFTESNKEVSNFCRSKYVQSNMLGVYKQVKQQLLDGKTVLFTGTPCHTTALSAFIGKKLSDQLFLIDIICHGVPSPMVWEDFKRYLCDKENADIENIETIQFKYKDSTHAWLHPGFLIRWKDGKQYLDYSNNSWYENGYLGNLYVRPSCHNCKFKSLSSTSDMTIGDFWGCKEIYPDFYDKAGVSVVFIKTEKGRQLFDLISKKCDSIEISIEEACRKNLRIISASEVDVFRKIFWKKYLVIRNESLDLVENLVQKYTCNTMKKRIARKIYHVVKKRSI